MAPFIALALKLAPFLIPEAVKALGGDKAGEAATAVMEVAKKVAGVEGEEAVAAINNNPALQGQFALAMSAERVRFRELDVEEQRIAAEDKANARKTFGTDRAVFWLGMAVLATYSVVLGGALYGAYWLLVAGGMAALDAGSVAAVFGLIGAIVGYIASDAKMVISYYFGSSRGSSDKSDTLAKAFSAMVKK